MSILFSRSELLEMALNMERNGIAFYQALANETQNKDSKAIYDHLAQLSQLKQTLEKPSITSL